MCKRERIRSRALCLARSRKAEKRRRRCKRTRKHGHRRTFRPGSITCVGFLGKFGLLETVRRLIGKRAKQAMFDIDGCFAALILRAIVGIGTVKALVAYVANPKVSKQLGFKGPLTFADPIAKVLMKFTVPIAQTLLNTALRGVLIFTGAKAAKHFVLIDSTYLIVYGKTYEKAKKGHSSLKKMKVMGYRLQVAYDFETRLPLAIYLTSGNETDQTSLSELVRRLVRILGERRPTLVMDRGYFAIARCKYLTQKGFSFVIRAKVNANWIKTGIAIAHQKGFTQRSVKYKTSSATVVVPDTRIKLKLVVARHRKYKKPMFLVTTHLDWTDSQVYNAYKKRGFIEAFFKELRQRWNLNTFVGTTWKQVIGHLYTTLIGYIVHQGIRLGLDHTRHGMNVLDFRERVYALEIPAELDELDLKRASRVYADLAAVLSLLLAPDDANPLLEGLFATCTTSIPDEKAA